MKMEDCTVEENIQIARDTYKMKIKGNFVKECRTPGQFINIRIGDGREHILRRPISISEIDRAENSVTIIYRIVGEGTKFLANVKKGNDIDIMGPLGRGYDVLSLKKGQTALLAGGGIGIPPLYELSKQFNQRGIKTIHLLGFNTQEEIFYEEEFSKLGETHVSTVDGSYGVKGFITDIIKKLQERNSLNFDKYYSCGPVPMLKTLIKELGEDGYVSLENRMACGIGACYACVCKKKHKIGAPLNNKKVEYTRVCYDGPVYLASDIEIE